MEDFYSDIIPCLTFQPVTTASSSYIRSYYQSVQV